MFRVESPAMKAQIYQVLHVLFMVLLTGFVFQAFANPDPKNKKRTMMVTGILSFLMLTGGMGLLAVQGHSFPWPWWAWVKIVCWLGLTGIAGMAYRKPEKIPVFTAVTIALIATAVIVVVFKQGTAASFQ